MRNAMDNGFPNAGEGLFLGLGATAQLMDPWLKAWARAGAECARLSSRRARAYLELPEQLGRCRTPQDCAHETTEFWQAMFRDYAESSQRIASGWSVILESGQQATDGKPQRDFITFPETGEEVRDVERDRNSRRAA